MTDLDLFTYSITQKDKPKCISDISSPQYDSSSVDSSSDDDVIISTRHRPTVYPITAPRVVPAKRNLLIDDDDYDDYGVDHVHIPPSIDLSNTMNAIRRSKQHMKKLNEIMKDDKVTAPVIVPDDLDDEFCEKKEAEDKTSITLKFIGMASSGNKKKKVEQSIKLFTDSKFNLVVTSLKKKFNTSSLSLSFDGEGIKLNSCPQDYDMEDEDQIDVIIDK